MASSDSSSTSKQKSDHSSGAAGKFLANVIYLVTILFVLGFIWQSVSFIMRP